MTRASYIAILTSLTLAAWCFMSSCGGSKALDVTAPDDDNTNLDYDEDEPTGTGESGQKGGDSAIAESWDPCHEKRCGTPCTQCSPADEQCDEVQVLKECDNSGNCVVAPADCSAPPEEE